MNDMKPEVRPSHTPGPLAVEMDIPMEGLIAVVVDGTNPPVMVAEVYVKEYSDDESAPPREVALANARLYAAAPELLDVAGLALDILQNEVGADCPYCASEGTWTDSFGSEPRMVGIVHKADCVITVINAAIAKALSR